MLRERSIAVKPAPTSGPNTAGADARAAAAQGDDLILVCGGDGTLNEVINGMTPAKVPLGLLPGGTANIAAKELGLPHDPVRAADELPGWSPRRIGLGLATWPAATDAGSTPGEPHRGENPPLPRERRWFASVAGVGFDAYVVHRLSSEFKMSAGVAAYVVEAVRQAWRYTYPRFRCRFGGGESEGTFAVVQRTSHYAGWLRLAPRANLFQDGFSICLFKKPGRARYIFYAAAVLARQHLRLGDVELVEAREITCVATESGTPIHFELDGELAGKLPVTFEFVPDALTLLVP